MSRPAASPLAIAIVLSGSLAFVPAASTRAQPEPEPVFGEAVDVRLVNVDVYVTDRKGRRLPGLGDDDFLIYQDGQRVEVTNFSHISRRVEGRRKMSAELDDGSTDAPPQPLVDPTTVVIFIDNTTLTQPHRDRVIGELESFIGKHAGTGVQFMIAVYNPGLEVLTPLTTDAKRAQGVLRGIAGMPASGLAALSERRQTMTLIQDVFELWEEAGPGLASELPTSGRLSFNPCSDGWQQMIAAVDTYAQVAGDRVRSAQSGLLGLTRSLGGIPGRKSLLYLSDGLEQYPGIDIYGFLGELCPRREREMFTYMNRWDETLLLEELADYANAHRVTLYALETGGLTNFSAGSVEFGSKRFTPSGRNDTLRVSNLQSSLFIMADETGGQAFLNTNFPGPELARLAEDFQDYYSLGFVPPAGWDGSSHSIRVELAGKKGKGARLRYRRRYRAVPDDERMAERTLATLILGWEDNPLGTEIRVGVQQRGEGGVWRVPIEIVLPASGLGAISQGGASKQLVRVLMMAEDETGRRMPMREKLIPVEHSASTDDPTQDARLVVDVELGPGVHTIAVGVRDELNRVASYHRATVNVAAEPEPGDRPDS